MNELLNLIKHRRSIRRYTSQQIPQEALAQIIEAGLYAPNAGGGQRSMVVGIHNAELAEQIGKMNLTGFSRASLAGGHVSKEQPSIIDDPALKSGFYGAPTVCAIFCQERFLYSIPDAFCIAENMVLMATSLGIASCIVARGEDTFRTEYGKTLLEQWRVPEGFVCRAFVLLGYIDGEYPSAKSLKEGRAVIVENRNAT